MGKQGLGSNDSIDDIKDINTNEITENDNGNIIENDEDVIIMNNNSDRIIENDNNEVVKVNDEISDDDGFTNFRFDEPVDLSALNPVEEDNAPVEEEPDLIASFRKINLIARVRLVPKEPVFEEYYEEDEMPLDDLAPKIAGEYIDRLPTFDEEIEAEHYENEMPLEDLAPETAEKLLDAMPPNDDKSVLSENEGIINDAAENMGNNIINDLSEKDDNEMIPKDLYSLGNGINNKNENRINIEPEAADDKEEGFFIGVDQRKAKERNKVSLEQAIRKAKNKPSSIELIEDGLFFDDTIDPKTGGLRQYRSEEDLVKAALDPKYDGIKCAAFIEGGLYIDEYGHEYKTNKEFTAAVLDQNNRGKRFFLFADKKENPYCLRYKDGSFMVSTDPISVDNQVSTFCYSPKPSLKLGDIVKSKGVVSELEQLKDKLKELKKIAAHPDSYIKRVRDEEERFRKEGFEEARIKCAAVNGIDEKKFAIKPVEPVRPPKPQKPDFSVGSNIWRGIVKAVSLGFAETRGYRDHLRSIEKYKKELKTYNTKTLKQYAEDKEVYEAKLRLYELHKEKVDAFYKDELEAFHEKTEQAVERAQNIEAERQKIQGRINYLEENGQSLINSGKAELNGYHRQTEVRMEGIADIRRSGKISADNIFANTWLKRMAVNGKSYDKMTDEQIDDLAAFVASSMIEEKVVNSFLNNTNNFHSETSMLIAGLNNGSAVEAVKNSEEFKREIRVMKGFHFNVKPDEFLERYSSALNKKRADEADPINRLKREQEYLLDSFGTKPVKELDDKDLLTYARYAAVTDEIKYLEDLKNRQLQTTDNDKKRKITLKIEARSLGVVQDLYTDPFEKDKIDNRMKEHRFTTELRKYLGDKYKKAITSIADPAGGKAADKNKKAEAPAAKQQAEETIDLKSLYKRVDDIISGRVKKASNTKKKTEQKQLF